MSLEDLQKAFDPLTHPRDEEGRFIATDANGHEDDDNEWYPEGRPSTPEEDFAQVLDSIRYRKEVGQLPEKPEQLVEIYGDLWPKDPDQQKELLKEAGLLAKGVAPMSPASPERRRIALQLEKERRPLAGARHEDLLGHHLGIHNAPHGRAAQFYRYLVHRIEHADDYDRDSFGADKKFEEANAHARVMSKVEGKTPVVPTEQLAAELRKNPHLIDHALAHKAQVHAALIHKAVVPQGQHEPHVALTRWLDTGALGMRRVPDQVLSSYTHQKPNRYGSPVGPGKSPYRHLIPLKNIWASYDLLPPKASKFKGGPARQVGTQNEMLVSPGHAHLPATDEHFDKQGELVPSIPKREVMAASEARLYKSEKDSHRVASVAAFNADGLLLIGRRGDNGRWTLPGGHFLPGEDPLDAGRRELFEETSLEPEVIEYIGSGQGGRSGTLSIWSLKAIVHGEPDASGDPDQEIVEFRWVHPGEIPEDIKAEQHVRPNVTLDLLGIDYGPNTHIHSMAKAEKAQYFMSKDGIRIPVNGTPERREWNRKYMQGIAGAFAGGNLGRLRSIKVPVDEPTLSGSNMAVNKDRLRLYKRMLAAGDRLPPVVVQKSNQGWRLLDGNHRLEAARALGHKQLHAVEVGVAEGTDNE